ncbi:MAG: HAMP domain-containing sensor histidine kinase [Cellulosilyticaceae bacterium]
MGKHLKVMGTVTIGFCLMLGLSFVASYIGYQKADALYYEQIAGIIGKIVEQNPASEVSVVQSLKNLEAEDVARGKEILRPYGYEGEFLTLQHNKSGFESLFWVNSVVMVAVFGALIAMEYGVYRWLKNRFSHLQGYLMAMAKGNYTLNIEGAGEGKFSVLEDQIYKTTLSLRESKEEQEKEKLNLARNIADISHQLKTPLTSISIMTDLLLENELDEQNKYFMQQLNRQIDRLSSLVGVLLKLAKFDAGTVKLKQQEIVVSQFIEEILEMLEVPIQQKELKIHLEGTGEVCLKGDKNWTYEAIHNVLHNCVQHSPSSGNLTIKWHQNPIYTEILIQDEGGGVPLEDLPYIFTRFYKGQNASKESIGIGLAMAKTIVEKQNGEIKVANTMSGARFQIKFY